MIHRVVFGSIERFIGIITEHFAGAFPAWLAPVQVKILPVTDRALDYAKELSDALDGQGFRVEVDDRNEKIGKKIREATLEKVPYMICLLYTSSGASSSLKRAPPPPWAGCWVSYSVCCWPEPPPLRWGPSCPVP